MRVEANVSLAACNTLRVAATARYLVRVASTASETVARELADLLAGPRFAGLPRMVLGGGSNILFAADFPRRRDHAATLAMSPCRRTPSRSR